MVDVMNITEFAEQIVFGTTLEEKLASPGRLTYDSNRSQRLSDKCFEAPGRPKGMQMQPVAAIAVPPPRDDQLENEFARGQLLHRLANHELLATELMALVLLKFPDAPIPFRRGVLVTLQEEQEHTRMYLRRMRECGVEFGEHPLSGQFWRVVAPMDSPMDFVSRLSLTFEQANLDYSQHFAKVFKRIGDQETSAVLQKIYEDEIGHVQHGLEWFRQWKDPALSDWDAYQQSLDFPMSPQRARGPNIDFNREGRHRAGLDAEFIDSVEVFRQSRGKAATLRWFDPGAESELSGEQSPKEAKLLEQLSIDMEGVLLPFSKPDDILLVRRLPSKELRKHWISAGVSPPEFQLRDHSAEMVGRHIHDFAPWAWTPQSHQLAAPLAKTTKQPPPAWDGRLTNLFRKSWAATRLADWLNDWLGDSSCEPNGTHDPSVDDASFVDQSTAGVLVQDRQQAIEAIGNLKSNGVQTALVKLDLATSGRGQRRVDCRQPLTREDCSWLDAMLQRGDCVVEPELDRVLDLSFLWRMDRAAADAKFLGWTRPIVTQGRRYAGTQLGDSFGDCDLELRKFLLGQRCGRLQKTVAWLQKRLVPELKAVGFEGPFGVDALICRDASGRFRIKPLVELNPRHTMGHVALALKKRVASGCRAEFRILTIAQWNKVSDSLGGREVKRNQAGQWTEGVIRLSETTAATKLVPIICIGNIDVAL